MDAYCSTCIAADLAMKRFLEGPAVSGPAAYQLLQLSSLRIDFHDGRHVLGVPQEGLEPGTLGDLGRPSRDLPWPKPCISRGAAKHRRAESGISCSRRLRPLRLSNNAWLIRQPLQCRRPNKAQQPSEGVEVKVIAADLLTSRPYANAESGRASAKDAVTYWRECCFISRT